MRSPWLQFSLVFLIFCSNICAQEVFSGFYSKYSTFGASAISIDSLNARITHFRYPIYDVCADTTYNQVIFSCRQPGDGSTTYLNKGGFAALSYEADTLMWKNETNLYDLQLAGDHLLVSAEKKTVDFHRKLGYDKQHFNKRMVYATPNGNYGLLYENDTDETVSVVDINAGTVVYTVTIPRQENWADVTALSDSTILVAAGGLHCLHVRAGVLWSYALKTAVPAGGAMIYSPAIPSSLRKTGDGKITATGDAFITQLSSNILIRNKKIYFANRQKAICVSEEGKLLWETDLSDYDPAKMVLNFTDKGIVVVNFGLGVHSGNFVILNSPFVLLLTAESGEIVDQYGLSELGNLIDFMQGSRGWSFAGRNTIIEIRNNDGLYKSVIAVDPNRYGEFRSFIDGDLYHTLREGYHVPLNFIDDQLVYFVTDNNKIYGISGDRLMYEYHLTEVHKMVMKYGTKNILEGLSETIITNNNFELLCILFSGDKKLLLRDKLYFIDREQIKIVDLKFLK